MSKVQSIDRAFLLLQELAEKSGGISDLSRRAGLPTSTVARLLNALEDSGPGTEGKRYFSRTLLFCTLRNCPATKLKITGSE